MGLQITTGYLQQGVFPDQSFDVVTLWDVLEHCAKPQVILNDIYRILRPGGALVIQVPNAWGLAPRILREQCNMFTGFSHINLYGPESLKRACEKEEYRRIKLQSVVSEISVINNYLNFIKLAKKIKFLIIFFPFFQY